MKSRFAVFLGLLLLTAAPDLRAEAETGKTAPAFTLKDIDGRDRSLSEFRGKYVVLEWLNHGCPFVRKHYDSGNMQSLQREITGKGVVWLSINSSAEGKQGNFPPAEWKKLTADKKAAPTAVLLDPLGSVGKSYGAKTTPHMFVVGPDGKVIYKGAIDDRPTTDVEDVNGARNYVRAALDDAMNGRKVGEPETDAYGCSVKYK